ncbi:MAG: RlmE family RNA methyltransferase [Pseudomonadota bacterium]
MSSGRRGGGKPSGGRPLSKRVKTARGRRSSSTRWLERQLNDPYVEGAKREGWRSRAAYKLIQLDDRYKFLKRGARVVDLGAAPGGWTQVAVARCPGGQVVAIDLNEIEPIADAAVLVGDATSADGMRAIRDALGGPADVVLSDMAAPATGHRQTDHLRVMGLVESALAIAEDLLAPGGTFIAKVLQGGTEGELLNQIKRRFAKVAHAKPEASRKDSREIYLVAQGYRPE